MKKHLEKIKEKYKIYFSSFLLLFIIILISIPIRLWELEKYPPIVVDEYAYVRDVEKILKENDYYIARPQWDFSQAYLAYYPTILLIKIGFTNYILTFRIVSVIFSILSLIPFFFIVKKYSNNIIAFGTTLIFSTSYYYLQFSRVGWGCIYAVTLGLYLMLLIIWGLEKKSKLLIFFSGLMAALLLYTYRAGEIYIIGASLYFIINVIFSKNFSKKEIIIFSLIYFLTFIIVSSPWLYYIITEWDQFNLRFNVVSILNVNLPYHDKQNMKDVILYQISTSIDSWIFLIPKDGGGDENKRYLPLIYPIIIAPLIPIYFSGLYFGILNIKRTYIWFIIFLLGIILGQIMTIDPPNGARGLVLLPIIHLFISFSFYRFYNKYMKWNFFPYLFILFILILSYFNWEFYKYWMNWIDI